MRKILLTSAAISMLMIGACKKAEEAKSEDPMAGDTVMVPDEGAATEEEADAAAAPELSAWAGKWTGVEGTYATITSKGEGKFSIETKYGLDNKMKGIYDGTATADGISFKRGEETLTLKKATGDETGMKWLAGKKDCLVVKPGSEGYCRD